MLARGGRHVARRWFAGVGAREILLAAGSIALAGGILAGTMVAARVAPGLYPTTLTAPPWSPSTTPPTATTRPGGGAGGSGTTVGGSPTPAQGSPGPPGPPGPPGIPGPTVTLPVLPTAPPTTLPLPLPTAVTLPPTSRPCVTPPSVSHGTGSTLRPCLPHR